MRGQRHAVLCRRERPGTHCIGGWVGPSTGLDRCLRFLILYIEHGLRISRSSTLLSRVESLLNSGYFVNKSVYSFMLSKQNVHCPVYNSVAVVSWVPARSRHREMCSFVTCPCFRARGFKDYPFSAARDYCFCIFVANPYLQSAGSLYTHREGAPYPVDRHPFMSHGN